jgi:hypothetical protein
MCLKGLGSKELTPPTPIYLCRRITSLNIDTIFSCLIRLQGQGLITLHVCAGSVCLRVSGR